MFQGPVGVTGLKGGRGTQGQTVSEPLLVFIPSVEQHLHDVFASENVSMCHHSVMIIEVDLISSVFSPQGSPGFPGLAGGIGTAGSAVS